MKKIAISPYGPDLPNKYIDRMVEAIKYAYPDIELSAFHEIRNIFSLWSYSHVWFNWFENLPQKRHFIHFAIREIVLLLLKIRGVKIIATFHNRQPHEVKSAFSDRLLFRHIFKCAEKIVILSSDSNEALSDIFGKDILKKTVLIPHPSYDCKPKSNYGNAEKLRILFWGHLRPYKNIELIFELAQRHEDVSFTIAGSAFDKRYETELIKKADRIPNVMVIPRFLSSGEIDELIDSHSLLLLPYNIKSSLNSGVVIHGICKRINMIVPSIGTVNQLDNREQVFSYSYSSENDHINKLSDMLAAAKDEYEHNYQKFDDRISKLYEEVTTDQAPIRLSEKVKGLFD